jgi:hypothetical protein
VALRPSNQVNSTQTKEINLSLLAAAGLAAATALALGLASPALAAPSDVGSAQDTVNSPEASGFRVILNQVGNAPLDQCTVTAVRRAQDITQRVSESGFRAGSFEVVLYTTVYVDAKLLKRAHRRLSRHIEGKTHLTTWLSPQ